MNIELVGIPGVGKSYLCRSIEEIVLKEKTNPQNDPLPLTTSWLPSANAGRLLSTVRKLLRAFTFTLRHPVIATKLGRVIFGSGQGLQRNRFTKYLNLMAEMQHLHHGGAPTSLLTEQGVLQGVWSLEMLADHTVYERIMPLILPWLPDAIIVVVAESSQHEKQLAFREMGQSTFDRLRGDQLTQAIEQGEHNLLKIIELWVELRPDGLRLDFNNEPHNDARTLFAWLSSQLR